MQSRLLKLLYIRDLISSITSMDIGCIYFGVNVNLLAYADVLVLLALAWWALQCLLDVLTVAANKIMMTFNTSKTTCMVFNPCNRSKTVRFLSSVYIVWL